MDTHWTIIGQSLDNHWTIIGQSLDNHWTINGQSMDNHWTIIGQSMDNQWTINGQSMDNQWTINGQSMDNQWTINGQSMDNQWTLIGQFIFLLSTVFLVCRQNWYIIFFILIVLFIFHLVIYLDFWFYGVSFISAVFYNFFLHLFKLFHLHLCGFIYYI